MGVLTPDEYAAFLDRADIAAAAGNTKEASRLYLHVMEDLEAAAQADERNVSKGSAGVCALLGGLLFGPLGALGGAALGWFWPKGTSPAHLGAAYGDVYLRAAEGQIRLLRQKGGKR